MDANKARDCLNHAVEDGMVGLWADEVAAVLGALEAAEQEVEELRAAVRALRVISQHGALLVHQHWDKTGKSGAGCPVCIEQQIAYDALRTALALPAVQRALEASDAN